ncbi:hypothetical protein K7640_02170 [Micromonospora sp. PLK6-60]|uniref:condensation domain-containing protein n=1 Tax=Micromonospora sp. PLK6-60 TaxID=2873383 RepID=UPI001CA732C1|nr:condensation domain-containing protein [Micromonospora sp. PLK6-60]MBY8870646.1 hypothetical protein [Micromonospora sp. PLK6-60]
MSAGPGAPAGGRLRDAVRDEVAALVGRPGWTDDDDLVTVGLDSLDIARLATRLHLVTGANVRVTDVFAHRSVAALAAWLAQRAAAGPADPPPVAGDGRLSEGQVRLWLDDNVRPEQALGNVLRVAFRLVGEVDPDAVAGALATVVARHDALRTAVHGDEDGLPTARPLRVEEALAVRRRPAPAGEPVAVAAQHLADELTAEVSLEHGPLVVAGLQPCAGGQLFVLAVHHAAVDGDSVAILAEEISAQLAGRPHPVAPVPYAAFAAAEATARQAPDLPDRTRRWAERFRDLAPVTWPDTPDAAPGPALGEEPLSVPGELVDRLRRRAGGLGVTPFVLGLAAFGRAVAGVTGDRSFAVAVPHSAREDRRYDATVGFFVVALPVPVHVPAEPDDAELTALHGTVVEAMRHQDVTLPAILRSLRRRRAALLRVQFAWSNWPEPRWSVPGVTVEEIRVRPLAAQYDLTVEVFPRVPGGPLHGVVEYDPAAVTGMTARRIADGFGDEIARIARPEDAG